MVEVSLALGNKVGPQLHRDVPVSHAELTKYIYSIREKHAQTLNVKIRSVMRERKSLSLRCGVDLLNKVFNKSFSTTSKTP